MMTKNQTTGIVDNINEMAARVTKKIRIMEVCGTHTVSIFRAGLRQILPQNIELVSGPGCPVCVTPENYIDAAVKYSQKPGFVVATFGDMMKAPGGISSLAQAHAEGANIRIIYSPLDAIAIANDNPKLNVVFLAIGFETTAPTSAAAVIEAKRRNLKNFFIFSAHRLVPPVMATLLSDPSADVDGFLLPGHVAVVTGSRAFNFLCDDFHRPGVVAGFSPEELLRAVASLVNQISLGEAKIENAYGTVVRQDGNETALKIMNSVYEPADSEWRGFGRIPLSGLIVRKDYEQFDVTVAHPVKISISPMKKSACRCGDVLAGRITPKGCPLFSQACTPERAKGPCMVSVEGVCAAWYKYGGSIFKYE